MKLPPKIVVFPLTLGMTLLQWVGMFIISFSAICFYLLAGLIFFVAALGSALAWPVDRNACGCCLSALAFTASIILENGLLSKSPF
jgi:hypothetical protein